MGLVGTLAKVALGYAAARGIDKLSDGQGLGSLLRGGASVDASDPAARAQAQAQSQAQNPFANVMEAMQKNAQAATQAATEPGNPLADMMAKMKDMAGTTGAEAQGLLNQLTQQGSDMMAKLGTAAASAQGAVMANVFDTFTPSELEPQSEASAGLMLRAMIQAAKSVGGIDAAEQARILDALGEDADDADRAFVQDCFEAPVDVDALAADTPPEQAAQVYSASLMSINVDTAAEAIYLDRLAKALSLEETLVNTLHAQMGVQPLYS